MNSWRRQTPQNQPGDCSVGAGRDIRMVLAGDGSSSTALPAEALTPPEEVSAPSGVSNLPHHPKVFLGRDTALAQLDTALTNPGAVVLHHGVGGVGKSTLAALWATHHRRQFALTWWITADSPAAVDNGLVALAVRIRPVLETAFNTAVLRDWALAWLSSHTDWLVVLDNVVDPEGVAQLVTQARGGHFLITSRHADGWRQIATPIRLDASEPKAAVDLLISILTQDPARPRNTDGAAELCQQLGYLPLAIEQAGAFCCQTSTSPRNYLSLWNDFPAGTVKTVADGADPQHSIARVWRITWQHLAETDSLAVHVLRVLAWFGSASIPRSLLDGLAEPLDLNRALGKLAFYSMITLDEQGVSVNRLVQELARIPDTHDSQRQPAHINQARDHAIAILTDATPNDWRDPKNWSVWRTLLPHIDALATRTPPDQDTTEAAVLFNRIGIWLNDQGGVARAIVYLQRATTACERILGAGHPHTLASRNNLAYAYQAAGDLKRARRGYQQNLTHSERVLGPHDPRTLVSRANLAHAYRAAGDLKRAISCYEQTLTDSQRVLGAQHPQTLVTGFDLAMAYQAAGNLERAIALHEQVLAGRERILGNDHPQTLLSRGNLGTAYRIADNVNRAIPLLEQTLTGRERVLGTDHPDSITTASNLAGTYQGAGDFERAIPLYERTLAAIERIAGPDEPDTLTIRSNLADAYQEAGHPERAIPLFEQTLAGRQRILGPHHPDTLTTGFFLAMACAAAGDTARAVRLLEQTLADAKRALGPNHPLTRAARDILSEG